MSDPKKDQGYLLPDPIEGWDLICVRLQIPDTPEYRSAFRGALKSLTEWHGWERTGDTKGSQAATYWRQIINEHLIIEDCDVLEFLEDCDGMAKFELCWHKTEDGYVLRYTLNDKCTWSDVTDCETGQPIYFPTPDPVVPTPPEDNEGDYPVPEIDPANRELQRCRVLDGAFKWFMVSRAQAFINDVLEGLLSSAGNNIMVWLDGTTEDEINYPQYYPKWKALFEKHYPNHTAIYAGFEGETTWQEVIECIVADCLPVDLDITREVMNCISDGIESSDYAAWATTDGEKLRSFLIDYVNSLPLSAIRNRVFRQSQSDATPVCGECTEDPAPVGCGAYTAFKWAGVSLLDGLGWISEVDGSPKAWAIDSADFYFADQMTMMQRYVAGWSYNQNSGSPKYAGSIVYEWDDPFDFCDLYARVTTQTGSGNTRMAVAWAQTEGGLWIPLVGQRRNLLQNGEVSLSYSGAPMSITRIKLVGAVGGQAFRFNDITINGSMAP